MRKGNINAGSMSRKKSGVFNKLAMLMLLAATLLLYRQLHQHVSYANI
jgi:hypothetical protein